MQRHLPLFFYFSPLIFSCNWILSGFRLTYIHSLIKRMILLLSDLFICSLSGTKLFDNEQFLNIGKILYVYLFVYLL